MVDVYLAPMAGITDLPFRIMALNYGASFCVTEMLSAKGFVRARENERANREITRLAPAEINRTGAQIFGRDPALMAEAARILSGMGFAFIDINMGCPAPKIVGNMEGSFLMREPELAREIVRSVVAATRLPVTVKTRAGWDRVTAGEFAKYIADGGASAITVHARTRDQFYSGRADWRVIADVVRAVDIPVYGNGDITSGADALNMLNVTNCAGLAVGRAALGNPWLFAEIRCALEGREFAQPAPMERVAAAVRQMDMQTALIGEAHAVREMRKHAAWYLSGLPGSARLRERVNSLITPGEVSDALFDFAVKLQV